MAKATMAMRQPGGGWLLGTTLLLLAAGPLAGQSPADEPPAIDPFGRAAAQRDDALPGCVELSDGSIHPGRLYLTRDKRLQIADQETKRQREIPLSAVKEIECAVTRQWMEKEWKFKETASDEKLYTGRSYPAREYTHTITLNDGRTISGGLSGIVCLQPVDQPRLPPVRYVLYKRQKGEPGQDQAALVYVKRIKLGRQAYEEGCRKAAAPSKPVGWDKRSAVPPEPS